MEQENRREHGRTGYQGPRAERQQHREQRRGAQQAASEAPCGTKRWVGLWSILLLGIIVALGVITLRPDDGRRISSAVGNIGENRTASSEIPGMNGEAGADGADSTGKEMDGSVSESDESESGADDTTIMIENPTEEEAAGNPGTADTGGCRNSGDRSCEGSDAPFVCGRCVSQRPRAGSV